MLDAKLVASAVESRKAYERIAPHITEKELGPHAQFWWKLIGEWYARDRNAQRVDLALLVDNGKRNIHNKKHVESLLGFITTLPDAVSPDNVAQSVLELQRFNAGMELAQALTGTDIRAVRKLLEKYGTLLDATDTFGADHADAADWGELHDKVDSSHRIALAPSRLNQRLRGGVWPGSHILIVGRTDMGKTTLAINMGAGFLFTNQRLLYLGTEDSINALKYRMMGRLANMSPEEIEANKGEAQRLAEEKAGDRLMMRQLPIANRASIVAAIEEHEPTAVVFDQIRSYAGKGEGMTAKLEEAGVEFRNIISKYNLVGVSVTQANDRSTKYGDSPPAELGLSDIDSSRTGLPGTADLILGLGADSELLARGQRLITPMKNKFSSEKDSKSPLIVQFDTARSKVT